MNNDELMEDEAQWQELLKKAIEIARRAHDGQQDKAGADYFGHPKRVAARLDDMPSQIVAYLHDTIEDTWVTADYLREQGFPEEIVEAVMAVSKRDGEDYETYVQRAGRNEIGRRVKRADLLDNMDITRLRYPLSDADIRRLNKYLKAYKSLL